MSERAVVFDLGGVLVDWDPRNLYRKLLPDAAAVEEFLANVCTPAWNEKQDAGRPTAVAIAELTALHPDHAALIAAYYERFGEMIAGLIEPNLRLADELRERGVRLFALTNWAAETFSVLDDYQLLDRFEGRVLVSAHEGVRKPDPAIYERFVARFEVRPKDLMFIDDVARNVEAARGCGWNAVQYQPGAPVRENVLSWLESGK